MNNTTALTMETPSTNVLTIEPPTTGSPTTAVSTTVPSNTTSESMNLTTDLQNVTTERTSETTTTVTAETPSTNALTTPPSITESPSITAVSSTDPSDTTSETLNTTTNIKNVTTEGTSYNTTALTTETPSTNALTTPPPTMGSTFTTAVSKSIPYKATSQNSNPTTYIQNVTTEGTTDNNTALTMETPSTNALTTPPPTTGSPSTTGVSKTIPYKSTSGTSNPSTDIQNVTTKGTTSNTTALTSETPSSNALITPTPTTESAFTTVSSRTDTSNKASETSNPTTDKQNVTTEGTTDSTTALTMETPSINVLTIEPPTTGSPTSTAVSTTVPSNTTSESMNLTTDLQNVTTERTSETTTTVTAETPSTNALTTPPSTTGSHSTTAVSKSIPYKSTSQTSNPTTDIQNVTTEGTSSNTTALTSETPSTNALTTPTPTTESASTTVSSRTDTSNKASETSSPTTDKQNVTTEGTTDNTIALTMETPSTNVLTTPHSTTGSPSTTVSSRTDPSNTSSETSSPKTDIQNITTEVTIDNTTALTMETPSTNALTTAGSALGFSSTTAVSSTDPSNTTSESMNPTTDLQNVTTEGTSSNTTALTSETPSTNALIIPPPTTVSPSTTVSSRTVPSNISSETSNPTTDIQNVTTEGTTDSNTALTTETPSTNILTTPPPTTGSPSATTFSTTDPSNTSFEILYPTTDIQNVTTEGTTYSTTALTVETPSMITLTTPPAPTGSPSTTAPYLRCKMREGTSFTLLVEPFYMFWGFSYYLRNALDHLSLRFPCVSRQYTSMTLYNAEINQSTTTDKERFLQILKSQNDIYDHNYEITCNQSLLLGLKRSLEISPPESVILVYTSGSMTDHQDAQLQADIYTLLEEKKSQVYFLLFPGFCTMSDTQREIFSNISSTSFGGFINVTNFLNYYNYKFYQMFYSLELLLSKPLNSSLRILNVNVNVTEQYTRVFNVTTSLSYLLITGDDKFTLHFTDPNETTITFPQNPYLQYFYPKFLHDFSITSGLVRSPAEGSWTLHARGDGSLTVQVLGFTGSGESGTDEVNCSECDPEASCDQFGGDQQCTCGEGFSGDGSHCEDVEECLDTYLNKCYYYDSGLCVNTVGSYTCACYPGFQYDSGFGCVDVDECADRSLNGCDPLATCTNTIGSYTCTCPYGYYGDGKHCEVDECLQGAPCNSSEDCYKYPGSFSCIDPCDNYTQLNDPWRSTANTYTSSNYSYHCDDRLAGWYRFEGEYDQRIPEHCVPTYSCGTAIPIWMNGSHPATGDGIVSRTACSNSYDGCCSQPYNISLKMCPQGFYVYKLQGTPSCNYAYCTENQTNSTTTIPTTPEGSPSTPDITRPTCTVPDITTECGMNEVKVSYSKCYIELLGLNTSSVHLRDPSCPGVTESRDEDYFTVTIRPTSPDCGTELVANISHLTFTNVVYLPSLSLPLTSYSTNISCTYPRSMDSALWFSTSFLVSESFVPLVGSSPYKVRMGIFQDPNYTELYEDPGAWIDTNVTLYIGIVVEDKAPPTVVLLMKSCHVTTTSGDTDTSTYNVISDYCPLINDSTLHVEENGLSQHGRLSLNITEFARNDSRLYIACQIHVCNTTLRRCRPNCPETSPPLGGSGAEVVTITAGPLFTGGNILSSLLVVICDQLLNVNVFRQKHSIVT